ncbi:D-hexose-6-phosphate mutarotase [Georgenia halophila]|uniref:D-hexose-6-phosphate mutarotase n=1 Tax=Georgenia halophila TaxID=620889 RepID=UPI0031EDC8EC
MANPSIDLPPAVTLVEGAGGLPMLRVDTDNASAEISLQGAQALSWAPTGHEPVLWTSPRSRFERSVAIRGGIPPSFPWFAAGREPEMRPSHGFARLAEFTLVGAEEESDGAMTLTLRLTDTDVTGLPGTDVWPHPFELTATITVGPTLYVAFTVTNSGDRVRSYEDALHAYVAVADVRDVRIAGLEGVPYLSKIGDPGPYSQHGELTLTGKTDRVYGTSSAATVVDPGLDRRVHVGKNGSASTVVWNPWSAAAAEMPDLGEEHWTTMVCVEAANVLHDGVVLSPGESHTTTVYFAVEHGTG